MMFITLLILSIGSTLVSFIAVLVESNAVTPETPELVLFLKKVFWMSLVYMVTMITLTVVG